MNNRNRGNDYERQIVKLFRKSGYEKAVTSRAESRNRDALKVDLCNTGIFNIQCKNYNTLINYPEILESMPEEGQINVIVNKKTEKSKAGRFVKKGEYALLNLEDFMYLVRMHKEFVENKK